MAKAKESEPAKDKDYKALIRPIITEKSSVIGEVGSVVTLEVSRDATKDDIREAVGRIFNVEVEQVRTMNYLGKPRRRGRNVGRTRAYKKAYVTLAPGQAVDVVEGL